jgi:hypothetical protein
VFPPVSRAQNRLYVLNDKYLNGKLHTHVKQTARAINGLLSFCLRGNYTDATERIRFLRYAFVSQLHIVLYNSGQNFIHITNKTEVTQFNVCTCSRTLKHALEMQI